MILHILTQTENHDSFSRAIKSASYHDSILLMGDGVYNACTKTAFTKLAKSQARAIFALAPDCAARGMLGQLPDTIDAITDGDFVDLVCEHEKSITW